MTISPEEAKRLADELLDEPEPLDPKGTGPIGVGSQIGRYLIESLIATGGMGTVYRAKHEHPSRIVALKVVRPELLSSTAVRRFRHETELLGRLQHPGIAQIFEAGSVRTDLGDQPFFAMEFIEGQPLLEFADGAKLGTRARLELFLKVCDAVEHAHRKGVIHRDLKPGNVLVTAEGEPKILDFGVAKATDADILTTTLRTDVGQLVGTLPYMSPEQASGDAADIDTRSDVYSLGVLLYHLLSGRLPYEVKKSAIAEALRAIQEEDPAPLSSIDKTLRGDIETIVGKALEKDRDRRYQGASDFAGDIRRYLANETITARPASAWYQASKFARRNRGVVIAGCMFVASLLLGIAGTTGGMLWALDQKTRAETAEQATQRELARVTEVKRLITEMISRVSPEEAGGMDTALLKKIMDDAAERLMKKDIEDEVIAAELHGIIGNVYRRLGLFDDAERHLTVSLETRMRVLGEEHPDTLDVMNYLAILYFSQGRHAEAEPLYLKTLEINKRVRGPEDPNTLKTMNNLALLYNVQARYSEAEPLFLKTLDIQQRVLGGEHPNTLVAMNNLAIVYSAQARYSEAEELELKTLEIRRRVLGEDHPDTLVSLSNLAISYSQRGHNAKAVPLYLAALQIQKRVMGLEHPNTLGTMHNLASTYSNAGRYEEAEQLLVETLEIRRRILGDEHLKTLITMGSLALVYQEQGRYSDAESLFVSTLEVQRNIQGDENPYTLVTMNNLGSLYIAQHRYAEAESLLLKTFEIQKHVLGAEHLYTLDTISNLGSVYRAQDRDDDARQMFESSVLGYRRILGVQHPSTRQAIEDLAETYVGLSRREEAMPLYRELLDHQIAAAGIIDATANILNDAAVTLLDHDIEELHDSVLALSFAERACALEGSSDANDELWSYLDTLALAQHRTGDTAKAIETQRRAISLIPESEDEATREEFATNLRIYEAALP